MQGYLIKALHTNWSEPDSSFTNMIYRKYEEREVALTDIFDADDLYDLIKH